MVIGLVLGLSKSGYLNMLNGISQYHFLIMSGSFFGTLITLERVVTIKNRWVQFLPFINGSSIIFFLFQKCELAGISLLLGGLVMFFIYLYFIKKHYDIAHYLFTLSAICYSMAVVYFYYFRDILLSVRFFELFFLITIVAERMELIKFINVSNRVKILMVFMLVLSVIISFDI